MFGFSQHHTTLTKVFFCCQRVKYYNNRSKVRQTHRDVPRQIQRVMDVTEVVIAYIEVPSLAFARADIEVTEGSVTTSVSCRQSNLKQNC